VSNYDFISEINNNMKNKLLYGNIGVSSNATSHIINSLSCGSNGILYGHIKLLNTTQGNIAKNLIRSGMDLVLTLRCCTNNNKIVKLYSIDITTEIFIENEIYTKAIRNYKIDKLLAI